ncbi:ParA family protein [Methanogenium sp. MK-MG]|uniref:ParA family protein n=1 Tax=Methanogenium sp. MK-MG TaxID=2599926 RepID=UPI0020B11D18|nr:AAA family ATPase [Methanogenium sp. MK-MG]KAF1076634.1 Nitrogenase iron protein [Methanogenium sp. MK-MG]
MIITFAHHKGGTGKTTSCLNIAGYLHECGRRVLVIDCDPQANATSGLGVDPCSDRLSMYDVFMSYAGDYPAVGLADIITETKSGILLAPSSLDLVGVEPYLYTLNHRAEILKDAITEVGDEYDHILIDTPPSMGQFVLNGLVAADQVVVTFDSGVFALKGAEALSTIMEDVETYVGDKVVADVAVLTRWDKTPGTPVSAEGFGARLKQLFFGKTDSVNNDEENERLTAFENDVKRSFKTVYTVPFDTNVQKAQEKGIPLAQFAPQCEAASVYREIADMINSQ